MFACLNICKKKKVIKKKTNNKEENDKISQFVKDISKDFDELDKHSHIYFSQNCGNDDETYL